MVFQQTLLENAYFIAKMPGLAMVRLASSDLWKAPLGSLYRLAYPKRQLGHLPLPRSQEAYKVKEK